MDETGESSQTCQKCSGLSVKSIENWNISNHREVTEPRMPMWAGSAISHCEEGHS